MKKKLLAIFTSLLLVSLVCIALVACGKKGIEGKWRCDVQSPRIYFYLEIKDENLTMWYTKTGEDMKGGKATLSHVDGKDKCYKVTWSSGDGLYTGEISYLVMSSDNHLLAGNSSDIDNTTTSYIFTQTKISRDEWKKEIVNG